MSPRHAAFRGVSTVAPPGMSGSAFKAGDLAPLTDLRQRGLTWLGVSISGFRSLVLEDPGRRECYAAPVIKDRDTWDYLNRFLGYGPK